MSGEEQPRRSAEDASDVCCPGGDGMEEGKGQQTADRNDSCRRFSSTTAVIPPLEEGEGHRTIIQTTADNKQPGHLPRQARQHGLA